MNRSFKYKIYEVACYLMLPLFFPVACSIALLSRFIRGPKAVQNNPSLVWGEAPIINNSYWSKAMRNAGYKSQTFTDNYCFSINKRNDYDAVIQEEYRPVPLFLKYYLAFFQSLFQFDIFFISFRGYFLGSTPLWWLESLLFKIAGKKVVVMPFGGDAYVFRRVRSNSLLHGLLMSFPWLVSCQKQLEAKVNYWCERGDVVQMGFMSADGFGRWDILMPNFLFIDLADWGVSQRRSQADGIKETVYIAHAPNHRGFKGSEFVIEAVKNLKAEGLKVELVLIEGQQNDVVKKILCEDIDILVEQLIFIGHGLNGIEGMASGLPVISNLSDEDYLLSLRRWSFFSECPIVSGTPENLVDVLRKLITNPNLRHELGDANRSYAEKYCGMDMARYLFEEIILYLQGKRDRLINLYHPLLGEYPNRLPKIKHPLINNELPD